MDDGTGVTDELAGQGARRRRREELCGLDLLEDRERLGVGSRARRVVGREGEEHDEAEQNGEARSEHAEHARRAVAVLEEASLGSLSTHEEHGRDGEAGHNGDERSREEEVHLALPGDQ